MGQLWSSGELCLDDSFVCSAWVQDNLFDFFANLYLYDALSIDYFEDVLLSVAVLVIVLVRRNTLDFVATPIGRQSCWLFLLIMSLRRIIRSDL